MKRREAVELLALAPLAVVLDAPLAARIHEAVRDARLTAARRGVEFEPKFFTPHEWETVRVLVDIIIPRDERSGSATDAGVPEFMDFIAAEYPHHQTPLRGGLAWVDAECQRRFTKSFVLCSDAERGAVLDDIAWPAKAPAAMSQGVAFFNHFRDLTASGFFSSKMGVEDLRYLGNRVVLEWNGCPTEALAKLGVSYGHD